MSYLVTNPEDRFSCDMAQICCNCKQMAEMAANYISYKIVPNFAKANLCFFIQKLGLLLEPNWYPFSCPQFSWFIYCSLMFDYYILFANTLAYSYQDAMSKISYCYNCTSFVIFRVFRICAEFSWNRMYICMEPCVGMTWLTEFGLCWSNSMICHCFILIDRREK